MGFLERIAPDPRVKGVSVSPARDYQDLVPRLGAQNLHRDEAWKPLHVPPAVREPLDDLLGHPIFHRQTINDSDHIEPLSFVSAHRTRIAFTLLVTGHPGVRIAAPSFYFTAVTVGRSAVAGAIKPPQRTQSRHAPVQLGVERPHSRAPPACLGLRSASPGCS